MTGKILFLYFLGSFLPLFVSYCTDCVVNSVVVLGFSKGTVLLLLNHSTSHLIKSGNSSSSTGDHEMFLRHGAVQLIYHIQIRCVNAVL